MSDEAREPTTGDWEVQLSAPATLSGILPDLVIHTRPKKNAPAWKYALRLLATVLVSSGFHMVLLYRVGAFFSKLKWRPVGMVFEKIIFHGYHCLIPCTAQIGPGLWVPHPMGIVLNPRARLGRYVALLQNVEIADVWRGAEGESGVVGDRSILYSGAMMIKGAVIGEESIVAARALVTKPVAPRSVATGIPAMTRAIRPDELASLRRKDPQTRSMAVDAPNQQASDRR